jgi:hypothetical protein
MWYAPYQRIAFHNKFGYPDGILGRNSGSESVLSLWYCDAEKIAKYNEAMKDPGKTIEKGEVDNKFWITNRDKK